MSQSEAPLPQARNWRRRLYVIIFEADTFGGKLFDVALLIAILLSVLAVSLESVEAIDQRYHSWLVGIEWVFTILFTLEYVLRLLSVRRPRRYALSFFGIIDLLAILPGYVSLLFPGSHSLIVIRMFRLLRVFRIFKLARFLSEAASLRKAVWDARAKVVVFLATVLIVVTIMATTMYLVEGRVENSRFTSIPQSMYWAVVTMTTVGYGDVVPQTVAGKLLSTILIMLGYSLIVVPTGFVSASLITTAQRPGPSARTCSSCLKEGHDNDAEYCKYCGGHLQSAPQSPPVSESQ